MTVVVRRLPDWQGEMVSKGYWYVASATQGNITHDGVAALLR